jgi:hypothetical protein
MPWMLLRKPLHGASARLTFRKLFYDDVKKMRAVHAL